MSDYEVFDYQKRKSELSPSFDFALPAAVSGSGVTGSVLLTAPYLQSRITATVGIEDAASTFGSLTLTVEASDDNETWSSVETFTFTGADEQVAAPLGSFIYMRVTWEAEPRAQWRPRVRWSEA